MVVPCAVARASVQKARMREARGYGGGGGRMGPLAYLGRTLCISCVHVGVWNVGRRWLGLVVIDWGGRGR